MPQVAANYGHQQLAVESVQKVGAKSSRCSQVPLGGNGASNEHNELPVETHSAAPQRAISEVLLVWPTCGVSVFVA